MRHLMLGLVVGLGFATAPHVAAARDYTCSQTQNLRSANSDHQSHVVFVSLRNVPVRVYWIDFEGRRHYYATIPPNGRWEVDSFVSHVWLLEYKNGECYKVFTIEKKTSEVVSF